ncbi:TPA: hypothetical protein ACQQSQ_006418, partial [Pseudomonas aeruginosa]|uniref:hypothetical protein n=1 Tax=Pseudomonas aeruginosa TaxID=287 RepID=UPI00241249F0|nr:hypothetical protein [Pseudomonas aeruginosa]
AEIGSSQHLAGQIFMLHVMPISIQTVLAGEHQIYDVLVTIHLGIHLKGAMCHGSARPTFNWVLSHMADLLL